MRPAIIDRIIANETKGLNPSPQSVRISVSRAAETGFRAGVAEAKALAEPLDVGGLAKVMGVEVRPVETRRRVDGQPFNERPKGPFDELGLPPALHELISKIFITPEHTGVSGLSTWMAFNTADIVRQKTDAGQAEIWEELIMRRVEGEGFPAQLSADEIALLSAAVMTAQYRTLDYQSSQEVAS